MKKLPSLALLVLAACWSASQPTKTLAVDVQVASVALADDCPDPVAAAPADEPASVPKGASMSCASEADCGASSWQASCEQTTIQLVLRSTSPGTAKVAIKRIELIDAAGKVVGTMQPRNPTRWTEDGEYVAWNEAIATREQLTASYALSLPEGADLDVSEAYRVRVTLSVGGEDRTLEKETTRSAPAIVEPGVVT